MVLFCLTVVGGCEKQPEGSYDNPAEAAEVKVEGRTSIPESSAPSADAQESLPPPAAPHPAAGSGLAEFTFDIYKRLVKNGNVCASPFSTAMSLAALHPGTTEELQKKLEEVLRFTPGDTSPYETLSNLHDAFNVELTGKDRFSLSVNASLWMQTGFKIKKDYLRILSGQFHTDQYRTNFIEDAKGSAREINDWVSKKTREKIQNVVDSESFSKPTRMISVDTAYMFALWKYPFPERSTREKPFWIDGIRAVDVQMMHTNTGATAVRYFENEQMQLMELPYRSGATLDISMFVLLPRSYTGIEELEKKIDHGVFSRWVRDAKQTDIEVFFPRFQFTSLIEYEEALHELGLERLFRADEMALTGISDSPLWVNEITQLSFIDVNEKSTEVAIATLGLLSGAGMQPVWKPVFNADHPFLFIIYEKKSDTVLFIGRVANPNPGGATFEKPVPTPRSEKFTCPSEKEMHAIVYAHRNELERCHARYSANESKKDGEIVVKVICENGSVDFSAVASSTFQQSELDDCVVAPFDEWDYSFLKAYSSLIITYPVSFDRKGRLKKKSPNPHPVFYHPHSLEMRECYSKEFRDSHPLSQKLTRNQVVDTMRTITDEVSNCGRSNRSLIVRVVISPDGRVESAEAVNELAGTETGDCAARLVKKLRFPATGGETTLSYPFKLQPL